MNSAETSTELRCHVRRTSPIGLIEVAGALRLDTISQLQQAVLEVLTDSPDAIVLDLGGVDAVEDELCLQMFATLGRSVADEAEGELLLAAPSLRLRVALHRAAPCQVQVFATRAEAWLVAEQSVSRHRVSEHLPPTPHAPRFARRLVDAMCTRWHLDGELRERAQVVVTELVSNAVEHAGSGIELIITAQHHVLRIEVCDDNDTLPSPMDSLPDAPQGRGLLLVTHLTSRWGSQPTPWGKIIWADLEITPPARETDQQPRTTPPANDSESGHRGPGPHRTPIGNGPNQQANQDID